VGKYLTTREASVLSGVANNTAQRWAAANDVAYTGEGRRKTYLWTEADIERFKARNTKRGRRWPEKEQPGDGNDD
jgi:hypothetical protein